MSATERPANSAAQHAALDDCRPRPVRQGRAPESSTAEVEIPAEELLPGPRGYRVSVIDYDSSANVIYGRRADAASQRRIRRSIRCAQRRPCECQAG